MEKNRIYCHQAYSHISAESIAPSSRAYRQLRRIEFDWVSANVAANWIKYILFLPKKKFVSYFWYRMPCERVQLTSFMYPRFVGIGGCHNHQTWIWCPRGCSRFARRHQLLKTFQIILGENNRTENHQHNRPHDGDKSFIFPLAHTHTNTHFWTIDKSFSLFSAYVVFSNWNRYAFDAPGSILFTNTFQSEWK